MNDPEHMDRALEQLLADRSPREAAMQLDDEELQMLRMAQILRGSRVQPADPNFVERLHDNIFPRSRRISRRSAFFSGIGAMAAGILAGFGIERSVRQNSSSTADGSWEGGFKNGRWFHVATVAEVPPGAVHSFTAGHVQGFLLNHNGEYRALSRICTHMGCSLRFAAVQQDFLCPCHGAQFDLQGKLLSGPGGYYGQTLPPLPKIGVRVKGESVQVWGA